MSDYMFMLESHLSADQNQVVAKVQELAAQANVNLFLTGGAMRDMLGGFPIRDLDFTIEGNALKLAKAAVQKHHASIVSEDDNRKCAELRFPGGVTVELAMARVERYPKPGAKPQVRPAGIHEDLRGRDFTVNAIALSLNRASRGLLLDPNNGLADVERKELRAVSNYAFYDDPVRIIRLVRLRVRLGYVVEERTKMQYENARLAEMEKHIDSAALANELRSMADEPNPGELLEALESEKLLSLFSPILTGAKLNQAGFAKLQKAKQVLPSGITIPTNNLGLFLHLLMEKFTPKERTSLIKSLGLRKSDLSALQKLETTSKKLERELKSAKLQKPSLLYQALIKAPGEEMLFLLLKSQQRLVQDRIKHYLQKYLLTAQEITDRDVIAAGVQPGTPKFQRTKEQLIAQRLDARPKKVPPPEVPVPPPTPGPMSARGRV